MCDIIHTVTHIDKNLLIVIHQQNKGWIFRLVNSKGEVMQEKSGFESAAVAEAAGRQWLTEFGF